MKFAMPKIGCETAYRYLLSEQYDDGNAYRCVLIYYDRVRDRISIFIVGTIL